VREIRNDYPGGKGCGFRRRGPDWLPWTTMDVTTGCFIGGSGCGFNANADSYPAAVHRKALASNMMVSFLLIAISSWVPAPERFPLDHRDDAILPSLF
jgi:hypothetical protein